MIKFQSMTVYTDRQGNMAKVLGYDEDDNVYFEADDKKDVLAIGDFVKRFSGLCKPKNYARTKPS